MSSAPNAPGNQTPHEPSPLAAFLSYLIPGLGQIYQGRYGKGVLFMVSLLGMFMLGQAMGQWKNVYLYPVPAGPIRSLMDRWHYGGQFWIGVAAWPALWQHFKMPMPAKESSPFLHEFQKAPEEREVNDFLRDSDKTPDLGWVYTVVAGMLNILVMYDAYAGPVFFGLPRLGPRQSLAPKTETHKEGAA